MLKIDLSCRSLAYPHSFKWLENSSIKCITCSTLLKRLNQAGRLIYPIATISAVISMTTFTSHTQFPYSNRVGPSVMMARSPQQGGRLSALWRR